LRGNLSPQGSGSLEGIVPLASGEEGKVWWELYAMHSAMQHKPFMTSNIHIAITL